MSKGTVKTKGTRLYFAPGESEIHKVACATGIQGLGGPRTQIDQTCLDSEEMEYAGGLKDPNQVSVPFNVIPRSAAHQALIALDDSGVVVPWMVALSDQANAPTGFDSEGFLDSPGPTTCAFTGYVADMDIDVQTNEIVRGTLLIQRSGRKIWDTPAADLA